MILIYIFKCVIYSIVRQNKGIVNSKLKVFIHRITEYPEFKGSHKDQRAQCLALQKTMQNSNPMPDSIVQMLT